MCSRPKPLLYCLGAGIAPGQTHTRLTAVTGAQIRLAVTERGARLPLLPPGCALRTRVIELGRTEQTGQTALAAAGHTNIAAQNALTTVADCVHTAARDQR